jgi:hypothetical protein
MKKTITAAVALAIVALPGVTSAAEAPQPTRGNYPACTFDPRLLPSGETCVFDARHQASGGRSVKQMRTDDLAFPYKLVYITHKRARILLGQENHSALKAH